MKTRTEKYSLEGIDRERFWARVGEPDSRGCTMWRGAKCSGYGVVKARSPRRQIYVHRVAWILKNGPIPEGLLICHHCDNPACCNTDHMFLGTHLDNNSDRAKKSRNRDQSGEKHNMARLNETSVADIRRAAAEGKSTIEIAMEHGVSRKHVRNIVSGHRWSHSKEMH